MRPPEATDTQCHTEGWENHLHTNMQNIESERSDSIIFSFTRKVDGRTKTDEEETLDLGIWNVFCL